MAQSILIVDDEKEIVSMTNIFQLLQAVII